MADYTDKTEEPTPKKIEDARKKGNVPKSQDTAGVVTLLVAILVFLMLFRFISFELFDSTRYFFNLIGIEIDFSKALEIAIVSAKVILLSVLPVAGAVAVAGVIGNISQFGFLFTTESLTPDLKKIDPIKGLKNLFSIKKVIKENVNKCKSLF